MLRHDDGGTHDDYAGVVDDDYVTDYDYLDGEIIFDTIN